MTKKMIFCSYMLNVVILILEGYWGHFAYELRILGINSDHKMFLVSFRRKFDGKKLLSMILSEKSQKS